MARQPASIEELEKIEMRPDGDERFRAAVQAAAKAGPKHRPSKPVVVKKRQL